MSTEETDSARTKLMRAVEREMLRSSFVSLFWAVITQKKKQPGGYTLQRLADTLEIDKSSVSRWFSGHPNWGVDTISDIANALEVDLHVEAKDRSSGTMYTATGPSFSVTATSTSKLLGSRRDAPVVKSTSGFVRGRMQMNFRASA